MNAVCGTFSAGYQFTMKMITLALMMIGLTGLLSSQSTPADLTKPFPQTAFQAKRIAERSVPPTVVNNVLQIYGERNKLTIAPRTWKILFWDPSAEQNVRSVTVTDDRVVEVKAGYVELDKLRLAAYKMDETIIAGSLMVDSNQALEKVRATMQLQNITLSSVEYWLKKEKDHTYASWKLILYVAQGGEEVELGHASISAQTGELLECVLKRDKTLQ